MSTSSDLSFQDTKFYGAGGSYRVFAPFASNKDTSRELSVEKLDSKGAISMAIVLEKNTYIQRLFLNEGTFKTDECVLIFKALNRNKFLKQLKIQGNKPELGTALIHAISQVLIRNRSLESLSLDGSLQNQCNFSPLAEFAYKSFWLKCLDLSGSVSDAQADDLSAFISSSPALETLGLRRCYPFGMTALGFSKIVHAYGTSKSLRSLDFSQNQDGLEGIKTTEIELLALSLIGNTNLRNLYLMGNVLTSEALSSLSDALGSNTTLCYLTLDEVSSGRETDTIVTSSPGDETTDGRPQWNSIQLSTFRNRLLCGTDPKSFLTLYAELHKFDGSILLDARKAWLCKVCSKWRFRSLNRTSDLLPPELTSFEKNRILSTLAAKELSIRVEEVSEQVTLTPSKRPLSNIYNSPSKQAKIDL